MQVGERERMESDDKIMSSMEKVRPSSPTPQHQQKYKLSMIDQVTPPMVIPIVLYFVIKQQQQKQQPDDEYCLFNNNIADHQTHITEQLKRSLSTTLSRFYPLSGRINADGQSIDCNDEGVPFRVVKFTGQKLSDLLKSPDQNLPRRLLPCEVTWDGEQPPDGCVALTQLSHFDCGSFAIGAVFWHKVGDAVTIGTFLQSWAAAANVGSTKREPVSPDYTASSVFPQREELAANQSGSLAGIMRKGKSVMRRYVFDGMSISSLKSLAAVAEKEERRGPSRVEVVSALIWRCFMAASLVNNRSASVLTHAVNMRRRAEPPFASNCFGNFAAGSAAVCDNVSGGVGGGEDVDHQQLGRLVGKMREAISNVDGGYVERMRVPSGYLENLRRTWKDVTEGADPLCISSWCNMGLYDVDFGWGKPTWINRFDTGNSNLGTAPFFINLVWLMDTRGGDGVEAWVTLDEKYMSVFDRVQLLRDHATIDPSPLDIAFEEPTPPLLQIPLP